MRTAFLLYRAFQAYETETGTPNPLRLIRQTDDMYTATELLEEVSSPEHAFENKVQTNVAHFLSAFFYDAEDILQVGTVFDKNYRDGFDSRVKEDLKTGRIIPTKRVNLFEYVR